MTRSTLRTALTVATRAILDRVVRDASAHCDTEDGPAVVDGRRALATGNVNLALKWVHAAGEDEVRAAFRAALAARGDDAATADQRFLETLVRVHRAGEGAGFDGIQPTGADVPPEVRAADEALETGSIEPMRGLVDAGRWAELERRFDAALALKDFDEDDLDAARAYVAAYVSFFKYAEGEEHEHGHGGHDAHVLPAHHTGHSAHAHH